MISALVKAALPAGVRQRLSEWRTRSADRRIDRSLHGKSTKEVFTEIYHSNFWGGQGFHSGHGSHQPRYVEPYVAAVRQFLDGLPTRPSVVDLGCGDFNVGRQLHPSASRYVGCDVVDELVASHSATYRDGNLSFAALNLCTDPLPEGDVATLRQVLQHMSNDDISAVLAKARQYPYLIVTEYIPKGTFEPNLDQPSGLFSRMARGIRSGIVLTAPPFNLRPLSERVLAEVEDQDAVLRTIVYRLR